MPKKQTKRALDGTLAKHVVESAAPAEKRTRTNGKGKAPAPPVEKKTKKSAHVKEKEADIMSDSGSVDGSIDDLVVESEDDNDPEYVEEEDDDDSEDDEDAEEVRAVLRAHARPGASLSHPRGPCVYFSRRISSPTRSCRKPMRPSARSRPRRR